MDRQEFQSIASFPEGYAARGELATGYCVQGQADCVSCGIENLKKFMHAGIIVSCFMERMKIWTIALNVE